MNNVQISELLKPESGSVMRCPIVHFLIDYLENLRNKLNMVGISKVMPVESEFSIHYQIKRHRKQHKLLACMEENIFSRSLAKALESTLLLVAPISIKEEAMDSYSSVASDPRNTSIAAQVFGEIRPTIPV